jgi:hypothetical protein
MLCGLTDRRQGVYDFRAYLLGRKSWPRPRRWASEVLTLGLSFYRLVLVRFPSLLACLKYWSSSSGCHTRLAPIFKPPGNWPELINRLRVLLDMPAA